MARGFRAAEGFAKEGKWVVGKTYSVTSESKNSNGTKFVYEQKYFGLKRDQASPERLAALEKIREESEINVPVFRGMRGHEVMDSKKADEATKARIAAYSKDEKRKNAYYGAMGDNLFHFAEELDHALDYVPTPTRSQTINPDGSIKTDFEPWRDYQEERVKGDKGVVEGVLVSKALLNLDSLPKGLSTYYRDSDTDELKGRSYTKTEWAKIAVDAVAAAYEKKFGKPMPPDFGAPPSKKGKPSDFPEDSRWLYGALMDDPKLGKLNTSYMLLKTTPFKRVFKEGGWDAVKYNDSSGGQSHTSYAVKNPNQFKAYAGDKKVNLKSNNIFDAD